MAEAEQEVEKLESKASVEQQEAATKLGWIAPRSYRGAAERFIDADKFLERGETVLPIVKQQLKATRDELAALQTSAVETRTALEEANKALAAIELRHTVDKQRAVEEAKKSVKAALAKASEAGDHEGVAELTEELVELNTAIEEAPKKEEPKKEAPKAPEISPELKDWMAENLWFGKDKKMTAYCMGAGEEARDAGDKTKGRAFYDKIGAETLEFFGKAPKVERDSKVEGSRGGANNSRQSGKRDFASLPAEARAACQADTRQFVGEGKIYKTAADWHAAYAAEYYRQEGA